MKTAAIFSLAVSANAATLRFGSGGGAVIENTATGALHFGGASCVDRSNWCGQFQDGVKCPVSASATVVSSNTFKVAGSNDANVALYSDNTLRFSTSDGGCVGLDHTAPTLPQVTISKRTSLSQLVFKNAATGSYDARIHIDAAGKMWLQAASFLEDSITVVPPTPAPTPNPYGNKLYAGQALRPGQELVSDNGQYRFVMQASDGNAVVYNQAGQHTFNTGPKGAGTAFAVQTDGNAVTEDASGTFNGWTSHTINPPGQTVDGGGNRVKLIMQDDGNLVLYTNGGTYLWASNHQGGCAFPNTNACGRNELVYGFAYLRPDQTLLPDQFLISPNRQYRFVMQASDGNAVVYNQAGQHTFNTGPKGAGASMKLQGDGNLVMYNNGNYANWNANTQGAKVDSLLIQDDGNLVIYSPARNWIWASANNNNAGGRNAAYLTVSR